MTIRQRLFQQKGQVDTQWEMIGSPTALPSSETVAEYNTTDAQGADTVNAAYGGAGNVGQKNAAGEAVWLQVDDLHTGEQDSGVRYDAAVSKAYPDNWDDIT